MYLFKFNSVTLNEIHSFKNPLFCLKNTAMIKYYIVFIISFLLNSCLLQKYKAISAITNQKMTRPVTWHGTMIIHVSLK